MSLRYLRMYLPLSLLFGVVPSVCGQHTPSISTAWSDPASWQQVPAPDVTRDVVYTSAGDAGYAPKSQRLDVFRNAMATGVAKSPVLVYMHGGAWNHGAKPESWHGFRAWLAAGFSIVNVEYRLVDVAPAPAAVQDVRCVLSWVQKNASTYGFDVDRVVTYGTSAGGHLALLAAVLPQGSKLDPPSCAAQPKVAAVLDFYGPYHLEPSAPGAFKSPSTARWMGVNPQPSLEAKEHMLSPSTYIRPGIAPVFLAHGDADPTVPYEASVTLQKDLQKEHVKNQFDTVPGGGHGQWSAEQNQRVQLDSLLFLQSIGIVH